MTESLDGLDNDCDEDIDEDFFWIDTDMDGLTDYAEYHQYSRILMTGILTGTDFRWD